MQERSVLSVFGFIVGLIICLVILVTAYDASGLQQRTIQYQLADKWHQDSCTPMYDSESRYIGESCSDVWTLVLLNDGIREQTEVSGDVFKSFVVGDTLKDTYLEGRLGFHHGDTWSKVG